MWKKDDARLSMALAERLVLEVGWLLVLRVVKSTGMNS